MISNKIRVNEQRNETKIAEKKIKYGESLSNNTEDDASTGFVEGMDHEEKIVRNVDVNEQKFHNVDIDDACSSDDYFFSHVQKNKNASDDCSLEK